MYLRNEDELSEIGVRCKRVADIIQRSGEDDTISQAELRLKRYDI